MQGYKTATGLIQGWIRVESGLNTLVSEWDELIAISAAAIRARIDLITTSFCLWHVVKKRERHSTRFGDLQTVNKIIGNDFVTFIDAYIENGA